MTKKCPSLSYERKHEIVLQFYGLSEAADGSNVCSRSERPEKISLPFSPAKQNFNSLNILAEASRRVGSDHPGQNDTYTAIGTHINSPLPLDPSLDIDNFTTTYLNEEDAMTSDLDENMHLPQSVPEPVRSPGMELTSIAASANDILPTGPEISLSQEPVSDALFNQTQPEHVTKEHEEQHTQQANISEQGQPDTPATAIEAPLRPLVPSRDAHFVSESGTAVRSPKPKVRGKFTQSRRQEVQKMRQMGACLRCRMLKKTCSNGDPCQACAAIESPRIWKTHRCLRTKLVNEFDLYSVGLVNATAYHEMAQLKEQAIAKEDGGMLEIYNLDNAPTGISLKATRFVRNSATATPGSTPVHVVDTENDDITRKMERFILSTSSKCFASEENALIKTTLRTAEASAREKNDPLLATILELWACTMLLVDARNKWLAIFDSGNPSTLPDMLESSPSEVSPLSNRLINAQLHVGVEARGKVLAKRILGDLERRLLQRQRDRQFETFLAAVLLLNCFERISWLFQASNHEQPDTWPLAKSAEHYVQQGERFAEIIDVLCDMRSLPPRTSFDPVKSRLMPLSDQDEAAWRWFDAISITQEDVQSNNARPFDPTDYHSLDGRLFARLLRPDSERHSKSTVATR